MESWISSILLGTTLFVLGQVYLRKSFDKDSDYISTWLFFSLTLGIASAILLLFTRVLPSNDYFQTELILTRPKITSAIVAGVCFFIGNAFWIHSISTKNPIGNIRTIMAGYEMILLFVAGYLVFSETVNLTQIAGVVFTVIGMYLIGSS